MDIHFHALVLDGVYAGSDDPGKPLTFHPAVALHDADVASLARHIRALIFGHLVSSPDELAAEEDDCC